MLVNGSCSISLGSINIDVLYQGPGHTDADLLVHLPELKLLIAGDLVLGPKYIPIVHGIQGGNCENLGRILEKINAMSGSWDVLIPGHGPLCDLTAVHEKQEYIRLLKEGVRAARQSGLDLEQIKASLSIERFRNHIFYEFAHTNNIEAAWHEAGSWP